MTESYSQDTQDIIFLRSMIDNHKQIVAKAKRIAKTSRNSKVQLLAQNVASMQETQISVMRILLDEYDPRIKCVKVSDKKYTCKPVLTKKSISKTGSKTALNKTLPKRNKKKY